MADFNLMITLNWITLIGPFFWLAGQFYLHYVRKFKPLALVAIIGFIVYTIFIFITGMSEAIILLQDTGSRSDGGAFTCFVPGVGFALAAFPYQASTMSSHYIAITQHGLNSIFSFFGWVILTVVAIRHLVVLT